jgi:hypothetical protein
MAIRGNPLLVAFIALGTLVAGCGGGDSSDNTTTSTPVGSASPPKAVLQAPGQGFADPSSLSYRYARDDCAKVGVKRMGHAYGGGTDPEAVARAYGEGFTSASKQQNAFEGCLAGFKQK